MQAFEKIRGNGENPSGRKRDYKNFKRFVSSNIESPGLLSLQREEWWEQVNKYTEVASVWKVVNLSYMLMVNKMERKWPELHQELLNIKKNFLMLKTLY